MDLADALIKIALGDPNKLGSVASAPGVGTAFIHILCDLINDIQLDPVGTILKKISKRDDLAIIADFVMDFFNAEDQSYSSYDLFYNKNIYYDEEGNVTFYTYDDNGDLRYIGPRTMDYYVPVIAAGLDFLNGLDRSVQRYNGDILKAVLFEKTDDLIHLVQSLISYKDVKGNACAGALFYLLMGYGDYLKNENALLCYELLSGVARLEIAREEENIAVLTQQLAIWQQYLLQAQTKEDAAKLAKARELGIIGDEVTVYDEAQIIAAIEAKADAIREQAQALEALIAEDESAIAAATQNLADAQQTVTDFRTWLQNDVGDYLYYSDFYTYLKAVIVGQDLSSMNAFRTACQEDFDALLGEGAFEEFATLVTDNFEDYDYTDEDEGLFATDDFMEDYIYSDGLSLYARQAPLDAQVKKQQSALKTANDNKTIHAYQLGLKEAELANYEPISVVLDPIQAAANEEDVKLRISDPILNVNDPFSAKEIQTVIASIENSEIAACQSAIAAQREAIALNEANKEALAGKTTAFNTALIPLAAAAAEAIGEGFAELIYGDVADGSENIYYYLMNRDVVGLIKSGGRIKAVIKMLVGLYAPGIRALESEGLIDAETAAQLLQAIPDFDAFYATSVEAFTAAFERNPVGAAGNLIADFCQVVLGGFAQVQEELTHDSMQIKKINRDIIAIFDEDFADDWLRSYSRTVVDRIGEIYTLLADILGLSFIKDLLGQPGSTLGSLKGQIDTKNLFADATLYLYADGELVATQIVTKDSDGSFCFEDLQEGNYVLKMSTHASVPFEIKSIDVLADDVTDLRENTKDSLESIHVPVGDTDGNGRVDIEDIAKIVHEDNFGSDNPECDINCDGLVDISDLSIVLAEGNYSAAETSVVY